MKIRLKPLASLLCLAGFIAQPAMAATDNASLENQIASLQQEVKALRQEVHGKNNSHTVSHTVVYRHKQRVFNIPSNQPISNKQPAVTESPNPVVPPADSNMSGKSLVRLISQSRQYLPFDLDVPGQAFVSSGPYVGVPIQYAGSNLIINSPSVNTDVQLLEIRKSIITQLNALSDGMQLPEHSHLLLSGVIESQANYTNVGGGPSVSDIDVTNVSLDATIFGPSQWLLGYIELSHDNTIPDNGLFESSSDFRVANSRVYVNKAFVTIGNFNCSPFYSSIGQYYVPFGTYSTSMVSDPLTKLLARTKARAILVGFQPQVKNALYGSAYIFRGDSHAASVDKVNNGGINLGYKFDAGFAAGNIGGGVIANLSDSVGMQFGNGFQYYEQLVHRVPAYNARANISLGTHFDFIAEYVTASTRYNPNDMSYKGHGAKPWAVDSEVDYSFSILDNKPSSIGLGYAQSHQSLALGIPLSRTSLVFNTSLLRNTLESLELRHDREYAAGAVATGAGDIVSPGESGKSDTAITAQFDYYF